MRRSLNVASRAVILTGAFTFFLSPSFAETCAPETIASGIVASVIDGRSFRLADGQEIRLAGIEVPLPARSGEEPSPAAAASKAALAALIEGRAVTLKAASRETDRYGRLVAYAFTENAKGPVQHSLLAEGAARTALPSPACRPDFLAQEAIARAEKRGLWADPLYAVQDAASPGSISGHRGSFAVVEGKVLSVRTSGSTTYINFGRRYIEGFAVTVRKRDERAFNAAGLTPKSLEGKTVRVRGWIEQRGGPRIEAALPEQVELVN
jgi:endonuclease YncB( thermonuclease family)